MGCATMLQKLLICLVIHPSILVALSHDHPGVHSVHPHPLPCQVQGSAPHHLVQGSLAHAVGHHAREGPNPVTLDTCTMLPLVLMRWGVACWVRMK